MKNERKTEQIVRSLLDSHPREIGETRYWEQSADNRRVRECLRRASKSGKPQPGYPEFIVSFDEHQDFLIIFECKAKIAKHESPGLDKPADFAVDGVLHYARHLRKEFNVLAIAVSGIDKSVLRVSHFWLFKNADELEPAFGGNLLPVQDYLRGYVGHAKIIKQDLENILHFTKDLNDWLHELKVKEANRSLLISAILMALQEPSFANAYDQSSSASIVLDHLKAAMLEQMRKALLKPETYKAVCGSYGFMNTPGRLAEGRHLVDLIKEIDERVNSFRRTHEYHDLLGQLYVEFLRYSNSDKGLGIVLTPPHITQLAADLVDVCVDDVLYDNCAGTGGFLIAGMKKMVDLARGDSKKIAAIKSKGLVGVEFQPDIAALLCSNMFIHGDGRSNVFQGDCFSPQTPDKIKHAFRPTVGFLNPPFKSVKGDRQEMEFVLNNLESLSVGGRCVALLPMRCVLADKGESLALKTRALERHTLEAALSLPNDLFLNSKVGSVTCLVIFTAHRPHAADKKTWFAYCKDDGFVNQKPLGRCDFHGRWGEILEKWARHFLNRETVPGFSAARAVKAADEWCAEAYIETDYAEMVAAGGFLNAVKDYAIFRVSRKIRRHESPGEEFVFSSRPARGGEVSLPPISAWGDFVVEDLFTVSGTQTTPLHELRVMGDGEHSYVTTQSANNGVAGRYNHWTEEGGVITVDSAVAGFAAYQPDRFSASDHVEKLALKSPMNGYLAMFLTAILNASQFRYSYGRKASQGRLCKMNLKLPVNADGLPDYGLMEEYIRALPFSAEI